MSERGRVLQNYRNKRFESDASSLCSDIKLFPIALLLSEGTGLVSGYELSVKYLNENDIHTTAFIFILCIIYSKVLFYDSIGYSLSGKAHSTNHAMGEATLFATYRVQIASLSGQGLYK